MNISALSSTAPLSKPNQFKYNGKELQSDFNMDWMDYGARMYDAQIGRWNHVDPEGLMPYSYDWDKGIYVDRNGGEVGWDQVKKSIDQDSQVEKGMAIFVAFPDDRPKIPSNQKAASWLERKLGNGDGQVPFGHAGVILISESGVTNYFDFGRYSRPSLGKRGENEGSVRSSKNFEELELSDWDFNLSDKENVTRLLKELHASPLLAGYGRVVGVLAKDLDYKAMMSYARGAESKGYLPFGGYASGYNYENCATYCAKFARGVGNAGGVNWDWNTFSGAQNIYDIVDEYDSEYIVVGTKPGGSLNRNR